MAMAMPTTTLVAPVPAGNATAQPRFRCIQRPTGEWFTFAPNEPGSELPDAAELYTEHEARRRLADLGFKPAIVDQTLAFARAHAEISGGETGPDALAAGPS
jgi:hypothetical protein